MNKYSTDEIKQVNNSSAFSETKPPKKSELWCSCQGGYGVRDVHVHQQHHPSLPDTPRAASTHQSPLQCHCQAHRWAPEKRSAFALAISLAQIICAQCMKGCEACPGQADYAELASIPTGLQTFCLHWLLALVPKWGYPATVSGIVTACSTLAFICHYFLTSISGSGCCACRSHEHLVVGILTGADYATVRTKYLVPEAVFATVTALYTAPVWMYLL